MGKLYSRVTTEGQTGPLYVPGVCVPDFLVSEVKPPRRGHLFYGGEVLGYPEFEESSEGFQSCHECQPDTRTCH